MPYSLAPLGMVVDVEAVSKEVVDIIREELEKERKTVRSQREEILLLKQQLADERKRTVALLSAKKDQDDILKPLYNKQAARRVSAVGNSPYRYGAFPASPEASAPKRPANLAKAVTPIRVASVHEIVLEANAIEAHDTAPTEQAITPRAISDIISKRASSRLNSVKSNSRQNFSTTPAQLVQAKKSAAKPKIGK